MRRRRAVLPLITFNGTCDQTQPYQSVFELQTAAQTKGLTSQVETHIVPLVIHGSTLSGAGEKQARASFLTARLGPPANEVDGEV